MRETTDRLIDFAAVICVIAFLVFALLQLRGCTETVKCLDEDNAPSVCAILSK